MATPLPYLASPGSIKTALERIRSAATPERVTRDFVHTKLQVKGGTGAALIPYLKKIGLVASDGSPSELYRQFRNVSTGGAAIAEAIKFGYRDLSKVNEYFYDLPDKDLLALIVQVTGSQEGDQVTKLTFSTLKTIKAFADFDGPVELQKNASGTKIEEIGRDPSPLGGRKIASESSLKLSYSITLNLPASTDQAVFNAIFRSLKEHLIADDE